MSTRGAATDGSARIAGARSAALLAGAIALGLVDALRVLLGHRLGLGPVGFGATLGLGAVQGALLGAVALPVLALSPGRRFRPADTAALGALTALGGLLGTHTQPGLGTALGTLTGAILAFAWFWASPRARRRHVLGAALAIGSAVFVLANRTQTPPGRPAGNDRPAILLITVASARADALRADLTPHLHALAQEGARFDLALAQSPHTDISATSLHRALPDWAPAADAPALAEVLSRRGYATGAFLGRCDLPASLGVGFHTFDDDCAWPKAMSRLAAGQVWHALLGRAPSQERHAGDVVERASRWIAGRSGSWFAWVHLHDPTAPYRAPVPYDTRFEPTPPPPGNPKSQPAPQHDGTSPAQLHAAWKGEMAWTDARIGDLLDALQGAGWGSRALVVVAGLHGEPFAESRVGFHRDGELTDAALRVPLLLRWPGRVPVGDRFDAPVELIDIAPTLIEPIGDDPSPDAWQGVSLWPTLKHTGRARRHARARSLRGAAWRAPGVWIRDDSLDGLDVRRVADEPLDGTWTRAQTRDALESARALAGRRAPTTEEEVDIALRAILPPPALRSDDHFEP